MRDVLRAKMKPLVDGFADDLTDLLLERMESEFGRIGEALAVALSAIASTLDQTDITVLVASEPEPGTLRVTPVSAPKRDLLEDALEAELAAMLTPTSARPTAQSTAPQRPRVVPAPAPGQSADKPPTSRARACGCAPRGPHRRGCSMPNIAAAPDTPTDERRERIERVSAARSGRPPELGMRTTPRPPTPEPPRTMQRSEPEDDELERWPTSRIAAETQRAEASKHEGELPEPRSTFAFGDRE